jgi:hypothetical protein
VFRILVIAVLIAGILSLAAGQRASAHTGTYRVTGAGNGLNLRTGPGGAYRRLYTMPDGTLVKARGHRRNWMYLTDLSTGTTGWASLTYLAVASAGGGGSTSGGSGYCLTNYWNEWVCASADVANAIRYWAGQYGLGTWGLFGTAACESSFHIYAVNSSSGVSGLFQFEPSTFYGWGGSDLWDPWDQSRIAAKMFAAGESGQFECARLIGYA